MSRRFLTASTALALVVLAGLPGPASAGGGGHCGLDPTASLDTTIALSQSCFTPTVTTITPGQTVTFVSKDPYPHVITGVAMAWGSGKQLLEGDRFTASFDEAGIYPYTCMLHPGMSGAIVVGREGLAKAGMSDGAKTLVAGTSSDKPEPASTSDLAGIGVGMAVAGLATGYGIGQRRRRSV